MKTKLIILVSIFFTLQSCKVLEREIVSSDSYKETEKHVHQVNYEQLFEQLVSLKENVFLDQSLIAYIKTSKSELFLTKILPAVIDSVNENNNKYLVANYSNAAKIILTCGFLDMDESMIQKLNNLRDSCSILKGAIELVLARKGVEPFYSKVISENNVEEVLDMLESGERRAFPMGFGKRLLYLSSRESLRIYAQGLEILKKTKEDIGNPSYILGSWPLQDLRCMIDNDDFHELFNDVFERKYPEFQTQNFRCSHIPYHEDYTEELIKDAKNWINKHLDEIKINKNRVYRLSENINHLYREARRNN